MCQDAQKLSYKEQFDLVISFGCLQWVKGKKKTKVFKGIVDALKPGGQVLIVAASKIETHPLFMAFKDAGQTIKWKSVLEKFDPNADHYPLEKKVIERSLKKVGFQSINVVETTRQRIFKTKEEFTTWMLAWIGGFSTIAALCGEDRSSLISEVTDYYINHQPLLADGSIIFHFPTIIIKALKKEV